MMKIKTITGQGYEADFDAEVNEFINLPGVMVKDLYFKTTVIPNGLKHIERFVVHIYYKEWKS